VILFAISFIVAITVIPVESFAHRDGCHSAHSCPSDSGSYTCGDTGNCSECPSNQYCNVGNSSPVSASQQPSESVASCTPGLVCFRQGDFLKYESFLGDDLYYKQTYAWQGIMDKGIIAVINTAISVYNGKEDPSEQFLVEMNLRSGIDVGGQYDILQPSPVSMDRWLKGTSAEDWKDKVSESTYDFNGKLRQVILTKEDDGVFVNKQIIDKETGILLYRMFRGYGNHIETTKLVDTNIILSSNSKNLESQFLKPTNELIFSKSFSSSSMNNFKAEKSGLSLSLPSNWMFSNGKEENPQLDEKFSENNWGVVFFNKDPEKVAWIEIQYGSDLMQFPYTSFEIMTDMEILKNYQQELVQVPSPGSEIIIKNSAVERFLDGIKIKITYAEDSKESDDREAIVHNYTIFILKNGKQISFLLAGSESKYNQNILDFENMIKSLYVDSGSSYSKPIPATEKSKATESKVSTLINTEKNKPTEPKIATSTSTKIPDHMKSNAAWWALGSIDDQRFIHEIESLINQGTIKGSPTKQTSSDSHIPSWVKNNAEWWAKGQIDDNTFVDGIQFLVTNGILVIPQKDDVETQPPEPIIDCGIAKCITGKVTEIHDGDTIKVNGESIRFALISAPELGTSSGEEARRYIEKICPVGSKVIVDEDDGQTGGSYGRTIAEIYCNGISLNESILEANLATIYTKFCSVSEFSKESWAQHGCYTKNQVITPPMPKEIPKTSSDDSNCDPSYPDVCIAPYPPDLDCKQIPYKNFRVLPPDPHRFDGNKDGIGCQ